jgi:hypothetical protein
MIKPVQWKIQTNEEQIEEDYRRQKDRPWSWFSQVNIMKMAVLPKVIYTSNAIPIKIPITFSSQTEKSTLKLLESTRNRD